MKTVQKLNTVLAAAAVSAAALVCAPAAHADENIVTCPSGRSAVATVDTSCPFADNVASAWYGQPGLTVYAYSPVTDKIYTMTCNPNAWTTRWAEAKRCFGISPGGDPLVVYVD